METGGGGCETGGITYWGLIDCDVKTAYLERTLSGPKRFDE